MWSVPDVYIGTTTYSDDAAGVWWQTLAGQEANTSGACSTFYDHIASDFGWTKEQGQEFELGIDMRTLVLATAVNDGFISLDPDEVSQSMLPLSKKFYEGPDLEDDLFVDDALGSGTFDDIPYWDDDFWDPMYDDASGDGMGWYPMYDDDAGDGMGGWYSSYWGQYVFAACACLREPSLV